MSISAVFRQAVLTVIGGRLDYSALYPSRVVAHAGGPTVQILPDNERVRGLGLSKVKLRYGTAGTTSIIPPGTRCLLGFDNQDPRSPWVSLWDEGTLPLTTIIEATTSVALAAPMVTVGHPGPGQMTADEAGGSVRAGDGDELVALSNKVDDYIATMDDLFRTVWMVTPHDGGAALKTSFVLSFPAPPGSTAAANLRADEP